MILLRRASAQRLDLLLAEADAADCTYPELGATDHPDLPAGYHHGTYTATVGHGDASFTRAADGLRRWQAHAGLGAAIHPAGAPLHPGTNVLVLLGAGPVRVVAPCRIVYAHEEPTRFGFGYGTLPGHPERGEESFVLTLDDDGAVRFRLRVFSKPADLIVTLAGPVGTTLQNLALRAYARGLRRYVAEERSAG